MHSFWTNILNISQVCRICLYKFKLAEILDVVGRARCILISWNLADKLKQGKMSRVVKYRKCFCSCQNCANEMLITCSSSDKLATVLTKLVMSCREELFLHTISIPTCATEIGLFVLIKLCYRRKIKLSRFFSLLTKTRRILNPI